MHGCRLAIRGKGENQDLDIPDWDLFHELQNLRFTKFDGIQTLSRKFAQFKLLPDDTKFVPKNTYFYSPLNLNRDLNSNSVNENLYIELSSNIFIFY